MVVVVLEAVVVAVVDEFVVDEFAALPLQRAKPLVPAPKAKLKHKHAAPAGGKGPPAPAGKGPAGPAGKAPPAPAAKGPPRGGAGIPLPPVVVAPPRGAARVPVAAALGVGVPPVVAPVVPVVAHAAIPAVVPGAAPGAAPGAVPGAIPGVVPAAPPGVAPAAPPGLAPAPGAPPAVVVLGAVPAAPLIAAPVPVLGGHRALLAPFAPPAAPAAAAGAAAAVDDELVGHGTSRNITNAVATLTIVEPGPVGHITLGTSNQQIVALLGQDVLSHAQYTGKDKLDGRFRALQHLFNTMSCTQIYNALVTLAGAHPGGEFRFAVPEHLGIIFADLLSCITFSVMSTTMVFPLGVLIFLNQRRVKRDALAVFRMMTRKALEVRRDFSPVDQAMGERVGPAGVEAFHCLDHVSLTSTPLTMSTFNAAMATTSAVDSGSFLAGYGGGGGGGGSMLSVGPSASMVAAPAVPQRCWRCTQQLPGHSHVYCTNPAIPGFDPANPGAAYAALKACCPALGL